MRILDRVPYFLRGRWPLRRFYWQPEELARAVFEADALYEKLSARGDRAVSEDPRLEYEALISKQGQSIEQLGGALEEAVEQLLTLAIETYWTLDAVTTASGIPGRDLDAALIAKSLIDGRRIERARAALAAYRERK